MAQGAPCISGRGTGLLTSQWLALPASGNLAETYGLMVQQSCHRCQAIHVWLFYLAKPLLQAAGIDSGSGLDIGDMKSHPRRNSLRDSDSGVAALVPESAASPASIPQPIRSGSM